MNFKERIKVSAKPVEEQQQNEDKLSDTSCRQNSLGVLVVTNRWTEK